MVHRRCYRSIVRWLPLVLFVTVACNDLRDFKGDWRGPRVGDAPTLHVGVASDAQAHLAIDGIDAHGLTARLQIDGLLDEAPLASLAGAEADALQNITFAGSPLRVFLAFVPLTDGKGDALAMIALYADHRVEVRVMRGGTTAVYAIFALTEASA